MHPVARKCFASYRLLTVQFRFHGEGMLNLALLHEYQSYPLNISRAITEHSICHPGRPLPQGLSQKISPGFAAFQRAKSKCIFFLFTRFNPCTNF